MTHVLRIVVLFTVEPSPELDRSLGVSELDDDDAPRGRAVPQHPHVFYIPVQVQPSSVARRDEFQDRRRVEDSRDGNESQTGAVVSVSGELLLSPSRLVFSGHACFAVKVDRAPIERGRPTRGICWRGGILCNVADGCCRRARSHRRRGKFDPIDLDRSESEVEDRLRSRARSRSGRRRCLCERECARRCPQLIRLDRERGGRWRENEILRPDAVRLL